MESIILNPVDYAKAVKVIGNVEDITKVVDLTRRVRIIRSVGTLESTELPSGLDRGLCKLYCRVVYGKSLNMSRGTKASADIQL